MDSIDIDIAFSRAFGRLSTIWSEIPLALRSASFQDLN
jgi:hypothetical protein